MLSIVLQTQTNRYQINPALPGTSESKTVNDRSSAQNAEKKTAPGQTSNNNLTPEQTQQLEKLKARDREVRTHEQAHLSAAGSIAKSGATYTYQQGPDGKSYAVGGEVNIDTSAVSGDPQATLRKAEIIRRAALAPAEPSDQDRSVAATASKMIAQAKSDILKQSQAGQFTNNQKQDSNKGSNINYSV